MVVKISKNLEMKSLLPALRSRTSFSLSTAIPSPLYLPFSVDPRCEDRSFFPDILQLQVQCIDGECSLCPLRVAGNVLHGNALRWGVLRMITPSHRQCSSMYGLAMVSVP
jgi:hypothetical protein